MADAPDAITQAALTTQAVISCPFLAPAASELRAAGNALINKVAIPWVNSTEAAEVKAMAVGVAGKLFGGIFAGPVSKGVEAGTDASLRAFAAIAFAPPSPTAPLGA